MYTNAPVTPLLAQLPRASKVQSVVGNVKYDTNSLKPEMSIPSSWFVQDKKLEGLTSQVQKHARTTYKKKHTCTEDKQSLALL